MIYKDKDKDKKVCPRTRCWGINLIFWDLIILVAACIFEKLSFYISKCLSIKIKIKKFIQGHAAGELVWFSETWLSLWLCAFFKSLVLYIEQFIHKDKDRKAYSRTRCWGISLIFWDLIILVAARMSISRWLRTPWWTYLDQELFWDFYNIL